LRFNHYLTSRKNSENAFGVVLIGDDIAEGIGDYVRLAKIPGLARRLQQDITNSPNIRLKKKWLVRSAGVAGSTSASWLPPGAPLGPKSVVDRGKSNNVNDLTEAHEVSATFKKVSNGKEDRNMKKKKRAIAKKKKMKSKNPKISTHADGKLFDTLFGKHGSWKHADMVVLAVGSNDYKHESLRNPDITRHNIARICEALIAMKKKVFVVGLKRPLHVKEAVNLHRTALVRDYCRMAEVCA
jgi:lysophospholipase L1-like esterase